MFFRTWDKMTPLRRTLNNKDLCFVEDFVWDCIPESLHTHSLENMSKTFNMHSLGNIHLGVYSAGVYSVGVYNSRAMGFGSGRPTHSFFRALIKNASTWESRV